MTLRATALVTIRRATPADAAVLTAVARSTFVDTFAADNTASDMASYTAAAFGEAVQRTELEDPQRIVLLAESDGVCVGYAVLMDAPAPDVVGRDAMEIARLYSVRERIGSGIGAALMRRCLDEAAAHGKQRIWLGVWEHNPRAIGFYKRWGFRDVGSQGFLLGSDQQTDRIMMRDIEER